MKRVFTPILTFCTFALFFVSCADEEQEQLLLQLQGDLSKANAAIDSLTYSLDDSNLLLDGMRAQVDSAQHVNDTMLNNMKPNCAMPNISQTSWLCSKPFTWRAA